MQRKNEKGLFKIALEGSQAPAGQIGEAIEVDIEFIVLIHVRLQVDLPGFAEIKEYVFQGGVGLQQDHHRLFDLKGS